MDVDVYSLDYNKLPAEKIRESEARLGVKITLLKRSKWLDWVICSRLGLVIRLAMPCPVHNYITLSQEQENAIKTKGYDGIWIYGEEMSRVARQFAEYKRCHLLPDCTSLFYYRMLGQRFVTNSLGKMLKNFLFYRKFMHMEKAFDTSKNIHYFLVGDADTQSLRNLKPELQAHFIRHPHYDISDGKASLMRDGEKIKLLIAGRYDYYMHQDGDLFVHALCQNKVLSADYRITILGKGWEANVAKLRSAGYDIEHITFAPNYIEEISKHDIQITPISVGTGTKGKVLDALANGLLVAGTWWALENIAVKDGESCVQYSCAENLIEVLREIPSQREKYRQIAAKGREAILTEHSREKLSAQFFEYFRH